MKIVFSGSVGRFPVGGHAWINLQYLAGLIGLGHEVCYLEECGAESWMYDWEQQRSTTDLDAPAAYVRACLASVGMQERWIYRAGGESRGLCLEAFLEICARADLLIVRAVPLACWRPEYTWPRRKIFIDVDPGYTQRCLAAGDAALVETVAKVDRLFTTGVRLGDGNCSIPTAGREWLPTLPPVWLPEWPYVEDGDVADCFTTVMQWRSYRQGHRYRRLARGRQGAVHGDGYGQKAEQFEPYLDLPQHVHACFRVALTGGPGRLLMQHGWQVQEGWKATRTPNHYRAFIRQSRGEFSVAKQGYVATASGWISDRTVCYLACGLPALVQDTGSGSAIPLGEGALCFRQPDDARRGIEEICLDYERHRRAARRLAEEYFATHRVLPALLDAADAG